MTIQISRHTIIGAPSMRITRPKSAAAFSPLDLSPVLWLDFSDASTLFQDSAGNTPVASDGDVIGRVEDKSGNLNHATQGTTANKPLYKTGIQNGLSVGRWDGSDDYLDHPVLVSDPDELTIVIAVKRTAGTGNVVLWGHRSETTRLIQVTWKGSTEIVLQLRGSGNNLVEVSNTPVTLTSFHLASAIFDNVQNSHNVWLNGSGTTPDTTDFGAETFTSTKNLLGGTDVGNGAVATIQGDVGEVVILPSALSTADRQSLETYLNDKWAVF